MITATTRLVALLGHPVAHSRSPAMQNAAFAARGLDWAYVALDVAPEDLEDALRGLVALGFAGANVTIPHKRAVAELCDELDRAATRAVSVNTLVFRDGRILGSSTDGLAVVEAVEARGARALVLGGGGAGHAVAAALADAGAGVRVATRRDPDWPPRETDATILVNATPLVDEVAGRAAAGTDRRRPRLPAGRRRHRAGRGRAPRRLPGRRRARRARPAGRGVVPDVDRGGSAARADARRRQALGRNDEGGPEAPFAASDVR